VVISHLYCSRIQNLTLMVMIRLIFIGLYCMVILLVLCWILNNNCTLLYIVSHSFCSLRVASVNIAMMKDVEFTSEQVSHAFSLPARLCTCAPSARATLSMVGGTSYDDTYHYKCEIHSFCLIIWKGPKEVNVWCNVTEPVAWYDPYLSV